MLKRSLLLFYRFVSSQARILVFLILLLTIVSLFFLSKLDVVSDLLDLLPRHDPQVRTFIDLVEHFGPEESVVLIIAPEHDATIDICIDYVEGLSETLSKSPLIQSILYKRDLLTEDIITYCLENMFILMPPSEHRLLLQKYEEQSLDIQFRKFRQQLLAGSIPMEELDLLKKDPLGFVPLVLGRLLPDTLKGSFNFNRNYFIHNEDQFLLVFIKPAEPPSNMDFNKNLLTHLNTAIKQQSLMQPGVSVKITGAYAVMTESFFGLRSNAIKMAIWSLFGVLILYGFFYRRIQLFVMMFISLSLGVLWTLGITIMCGEKLNVVTVIFPAFLFGLGADFAIHFFDRYYGDRGNGVHRHEALKNAYIWTGSGIVIACMTTSIAFFSLVLTDYPAFIQLALMGGGGLILVMFSVFLVSPLLLSYFDKSHVLHKNNLPVLAVVRLSLRLTDKYPRVILFILLAISIGLIIPATRLDFTKEYLSIVQSHDNKAMHLQKDLEETLGFSLNHVFVLFEGNEFQPLLEFQENVTKCIENNELFSNVKYENCSKWLPSEREQKLRKEEFLELLSENDTIELIERIRRKIRQYGLSENYFNKTYIPKLERSLTCSQIVRENLPVGVNDFFVQPFYRQTSRNLQVVTKLYFQQSSIFSEEKSSELLSKIDNIVVKENGSIYSITRIMQQMQKKIAQDIIWCVSLSAIIIAIILTLYFNNLLDIFIVVLPVSLGTLWTLGILKLFGGTLNAVNLAGIPLVIGIGIDDGIHLVHRFRERREEFRLADLTGCLRAIILTSLTSIVGFSSLYLSDTPGIISLGSLTVIGLGCCMILSLFLIPAFLKCRKILIKKKMGEIKTNEGLLAEASRKPFD